MSEKVILLVEDNPDDAELTMRALEHNRVGNVIKRVKDGAGATASAPTATFASRSTSRSFSKRRGSSRSTGSSSIIRRRASADRHHSPAPCGMMSRLSTEQFMALFNKKVPPSPEPALPVITFSDSLAFHMNGDDIDVLHVAPAHTDGDSIVYFKKANVLHMGDTYMSADYPFIDLSSGGTVDGFVKAAEPRAGSRATGHQEYPRPRTGHRPREAQTLPRHDRHHP